MYNDGMASDSRKPETQTQTGVEMMMYYAACDVNGPISVAIEADSIDAAAAAFERLDHRALIDGAECAAEDDLDFCGDGMSETEFAAAMAEHGYEIVRDLAPCWMLYSASLSR